MDVPALFLEFEAEAGEWIPAALIEPGNRRDLIRQVALVASDLLPGRFRYLPLSGPADWRYLELDPDGLRLDTLL